MKSGHRSLLHRASSLERLGGLLAALSLVSPVLTAPNAAAHVSLINFNNLAFCIFRHVKDFFGKPLLWSLVPGDALRFWNEGAGQLSMAASPPTAWVNAIGVAAVLTFVPTAAFSGQAEWPLRLERSEITGSGFDVRPVDPVTAIIQSGGGAVDNRPQITLQPPKADGALGLEILAPQGATVAVETTSDLSAWTESQRITGQGNATPVKVTLQADSNVQAKFRACG